MNETDLPCSDCGMELIEQTVQAQALPIATNSEEQITIATCPSCDARYYPEKALSQLANQTTQPRVGGDS